MNQMMISFTLSMMCVERRMRAIKILITRIPSKKEQATALLKFFRGRGRHMPQQIQRRQGMCLHQISQQRKSKVWCRQAKEERGRKNSAENGASRGHRRTFRRPFSFLATMLATGRVRHVQLFSRPQILRFTTQCNVGA